MVFYTIDTIAFTFLILYNTPDIIVKFFTARFCNCFTSIFNSKNNLVENLTVAHNSYFIDDKILRCPR